MIVTISSINEAGVTTQIALSQDSRDVYGATVGPESIVGYGGAATVDCLYPHAIVAQNVVREPRQIIGLQGIPNLYAYVVAAYGVVHYQRLEGSISWLITEELYSRLKVFEYEIVLNSDGP